MRAKVELRNGDCVFSGVVLVDTGAAGVIIDESVAERLGLETFGEGVIVTLGSAARAARRHRNLLVSSMVIRAAVIQDF